MHILRKKAANHLLTGLVAIACHSVSLSATQGAPDGELQLEVVDSETHQAIPVRVELTNARGRTVRLKNVGLGALGDHFYLPGTASLGLRRGGYLFQLDAGPEYRTQQGNFEIERYADDAKTVEMRRFANLGEEGWYAGDLHATRPAHDMPIVAATEGVSYAPTIAWHFDGTEWHASHATVRGSVGDDDPHAEGRDLRPCAAVVELAGGSLLLVADEPLDEPPFEIGKNSTSLSVVNAAHEKGLHVVATTPTAWDLPVWVASGKLDAVMLLTRQSEWNEVTDKDPSGRPRDKSFFPGKQGLPRWGQTIYFHLLNSGIRLPPVAGSGSGTNESPLGTNRTYVHLAGGFSQAAWWEGVASGATVVTNGPLLRPSVGGDPPGTTFGLRQGETVEFQVALNLASRVPVEYLEIIKDGKAYEEVRLSDWASKGGRLPPVVFDQSGWFAVRAATGATDKYQFALTAPYYVESPSGMRVSQQSVQFFLAWLDELEARLDKSASCTQEEIDVARAFWQDRFTQSNAP